MRKHMYWEMYEPAYGDEWARGNKVVGRCGGRRGGGAAKKGK
jgi:hypothetical protein